MVLGDIAAGDDRDINRMLVGIILILHAHGSHCGRCRVSIKIRPLAEITGINLVSPGGVVVKQMLMTGVLGLTALRGVIMAMGMPLGLVPATVGVIRQEIAAPDSKSGTSH